MPTIVTVVLSATPMILQYTIRVFLVKPTKLYLSEELIDRKLKNRTEKNNLFIRICKRKKVLPNPKDQVISQFNHSIEVTTNKSFDVKPVISISRKSNWNLIITKM